VLQAGKSAVVGLDVTTRVIPGGSQVYVDVGGQKPETWNVRLAVANLAAYGTLILEVGQTGTFTNAGQLGTHNALLMGLSAHDVLAPSGINMCNAEIMFLP
jgi:hypothetical protein